MMAYYKNSKPIQLNQSQIEIRNYSEHAASLPAFWSCIPTAEKLNRKRGKYNELHWHIPKLD
jgi:hypothetical protein